MTEEEDNAETRRGEALAELTAARAQAGRKRPLQSEFIGEGDRRPTSALWFSQPLRLPGTKKRAPRLSESQSLPRRRN